MKIIGYFENWAQWREQRGIGWGFKPNQIDPSLYTHINYAFVTFGYISPGVDPNNPRLPDPPDYKVRLYEWNDETELIPALQALKKANPALKTLLALGGWNFNLKTHKSKQGRAVGEITYQLFSRMVENREHRQEFIASAIDYARKHGFDGVDIDWEYPGAGIPPGQNASEDRGGRPQDFPNFLALLQEFRNAAGNNFLLTIAASAIVPSGVAEGSEYKNPKRYFAWLAECAKYLDWVNVMTYDYHGAWDTQTGVLAPLLEDSTPGGSFSVRQTIENYLEAFQAAGIPKDKIVMGVPTYGRTFNVPNMQTYPDKEPGKPVPGQTIEARQGEPGPVTDEAGFLSYPEVLERYPSSASRGWHEPTLTPYAFNAGEWVSYEDEQSIAYKASYILEKGLGGAMVWGISEDDIKNGFPLERRLKAIFDHPETRPSLPVSTGNALTPYIERLGKKATEFAEQIARGEKTTPALDSLFASNIEEKVRQSFADAGKVIGKKIDPATEKEITEKLREIKEKTKKYKRENEESEKDLEEVKKKIKELTDQVEDKVPDNDDDDDDWLLIPFFLFMIWISIWIYMEGFEFNRSHDKQDKDKCERESDEIINMAKHYVEKLFDIRQKWGKNTQINIPEVMGPIRGAKCGVPYDVPGSIPKYPFCYFYDSPYDGRVYSDGNLFPDEFFKRSLERLYRNKDIERYKQGKDADVLGPIEQVILWLE